MRVMKGDMFSAEHYGVTIVTTNAVVRGDGALVMGRGAARRMATLYPWVPYAAGALVENYGNFYGVILLPSNLGIFQVKRHWKNPAEMELIIESSLVLKDLANALPKHMFNLNFPGIGNGGLNRKRVLGEIESILPDNVFVWELE